MAGDLGATSGPENVLPVLMVIGNNDFYYKEYADPRAEFEAAGIPVVVAAGRPFLSTPHPNTGQGASSGAVMPDLTLDQANAADYSAIVFVGGYGANQYLFAFPGTYNNPNYNGTPTIRSRVNQLINDFVSQDKIVAGVCNGANVLAWARVNGQSLVQGRTTTTAHFTQAANNLPEATLYRWHQVTNGATTYTGGELGVPNNTHDDVVVDGRIITADNFDSAQLFGATIVQRLQGIVPLPAITTSVNDDHATEGGNDPGAITFARTGSTAAALVVNYGIAGSASSSGDYSSLGSSVLIAPGQASVTLPILPFDDSQEESLETVTLNLAISSAYTLSDAGNTTVTIIDNDQQVQFAQVNSTASEADGSIVVQVTLSSPAQRLLTIPYTLGGTATVGLDYTNPGTIRVPEGQTSATLSLALLDDNVRELGESVIVTLNTFTSHALGPNASFQLTINDNEPVPLVDLTTNTNSFAESGSATLTVRLTQPSSQTIVIDLALSGTAMAGLDYSASNTQLSIPPGQTAATFVLSGLADAENEPSESIVVDIAGVSGGLERDLQQVTLSLLNDARPLPMVEFGSASYSASEVAGVVMLPVTLTASSSQTITVPFTLAGTATSADRTVATSPLTIPAGQTSATLMVNISNDLLDELNETVTFALGDPINAALGTNTQLTLTIVDNDASPVVQFTAMSQNVIESTSTARAIVRLTQPSGLDVSVPIAVSGSAQLVGPTSDATLQTTLPLVIPAGQITASIDLSLVDDAVPESTETIIFTLGSPTNGVLGALNSHAIAINDNDSGISVQFATTTLEASEAGGSFPVFVTLSSVAPSEVIVPLSFAGSATHADYRIDQAEVRIPAGQTRGTFTIRVNDDQVDESAETIVVSLGTPSGGAALNTSSTTMAITIQDNDPEVSFLRSSDMTTDTGGTITVVAHTLSPVVEAISIPFATFGNASSASDYTLSAQQFDFAIGASTAAITLTIHGDGIVEPLEYVTLRLAPPAHASLGSAMQYTLFLSDAESPATTGVDLNGSAPGQDYLSPMAEHIEDTAATLLVPTATVVPPGVQSLTSVTVLLESAPNGVAESLAATGFGGATVTPYNTTTRTLTINGGTTSDQQSALRSLTYLNSSQNPTAGGRFITVTANFSASTESRRRKLNVTPVDDAPGVTTTVGTPTYVTGNSPLIVDAGIALTDIENNRLVRAEVTITDAESGDQLSLSGPVTGFTSTFAGQTLTITANAGSGNLVAFRSALSRVQFSTTTIGDGNRSVSFVVTDTSGLVGVAGATSEPITRALTVQSPLLVAASPLNSSASNESLTQSQLSPLVHEALARWELAGASAAQLSVLRAATIEIRDLSDSRMLGLAGGNTITLDNNAAGRGWFVDSTPSADEEFIILLSSSDARASVGPAVDRVDLLTTLMHEFGHLLGLDDHSNSGLLANTLPTGVRRALSAAEIDQYFADRGN
ncbi:MAG: phosphoribosylformylglycinamidine synthase subunit PurQ [Planctomycetaceae bacterium]|nr:phosphoribosylformylglycinamidine synthase subunit PurQ [Planctomycetaceae bacterium]